nr:hypothetical protein [Pseudomonas sp. JM0905a]
MQQQCPGLGQFTLRGHATVEAILDQREELFLGADLLLRHLNASLRTTNAEIGIGRFSRNRDPHPSPARLGGLELGHGRFVAAFQATSQVGFPRGSNTEADNVLIAIEPGRGAGQLALRALQRLPLVQVAAVETDFGQTRRSCGVRRRASLFDTGQGNRHIEVLIQRALDNAVEHRIGEAFPPLLKRRRRCPHGELGRGAARQRSTEIAFRGVIVGADRAAGELVEHHADCSGFREVRRHAGRSSGQ